jgi:hypothetical protein
MQWVTITDYTDWAPNSAAIQANPMTTIATQ